MCVVSFGTEYIIVPMKILIYFIFRYYNNQQYDENTRFACLPCRIMPRVGYQLIYKLYIVVKLHYRSNFLFNTDLIALEMKKIRWTIEESGHHMIF